MKRVDKRKRFLKSVVLTSLFLIAFTSYFYYYSDNSRRLDHLNNGTFINISQPDIDAPIISFIQPEFNTSIIEQSSYTFLVNITDDHPPLYGNVTFQLSNSTQFLFNASMNYDGGTQWSFNWNNLTSYPSQGYIEYIIHIWAVDNSSNHNLGRSDAFYIYLNYSGPAPGLLNVIIYFIVVIFIIAGIVVYLNKKLLPKSDKSDMDLDDM
jgi:hypothetical protein